MSNVLIASAILGLLSLGAFLVLKSRTKEERRRKQSIAEAAGPHHVPLTEDEQTHADEIHAIVEEQRRYRDRRTRSPLQEAVRRYRRQPKHGVRRVPQTKPRDALSAPLRGPLEQTVMLPGPAPKWELESFTQGWTAEEIAGIVAKGKAAAR
jgi:hypothetical protein